MARIKGKLNLYKIDGTVKKTLVLPDVFNTPVRPDIIRKAVKVLQSRRRQPYGPYWRAGMQHAVSTWGKGRGSARVQRLTQGSRATQSPNNVSGRRAHPPIPEKKWGLKMNLKEMRLSKISALAATSDIDLVRTRGHKFKTDLTVPVVVEDKFDSISSTKEVMEILDSLGVLEDIERAKNGRKIRSGRGKMRGRKYRTPRSLLLVVNSKDAPIYKGMRNVPGVDITTPKEINTEMLAPGGDPGRLTIFTLAAFKEVGGW